LWFKTSAAQQDEARQQLLQLVTESATQDVAMGSITNPCMPTASNLVCEPLCRYPNYLDRSAVLKAFTD
jgi:hypothetical protein